MQKNILIVIAIISCFLFLFTSCSKEPKDSKENIYKSWKKWVGEEVDKDGSPERLKEVKEKVKLIKMWRLTEILDLDETVGAKLFPVLNKYDDKRRVLIEERMDLAKNMRKAIKEGDKMSDNLEEFVSRYEKNIQSIHENKIAEINELKALLTTKQLIEYLIFDENFEREIRNLIGKAKDKTKPNKRIGNSQ